MKKFGFKKSFEEIEIEGTIYKVSLTDEDRKKYQNQIKKFYEIVMQVEKVNTENISLDEAEKIEDQVKEITVETLNVTLGEGAGEDLYEKSGRQTEELFTIVWGIAEIIKERRQELVSRYTNKK